MQIKQLVVAIVMASIPVVFALPHPDKAGVDLSVCARNDQSGSCLRRRATEDNNTEYKREELDTAVCARNDQSSSCLRRRATEDDNTEYKREELDTAVCARNDQSASCLRKKAVEAARAE